MRGRPTRRVLLLLPAIAVALAPLAASAHYDECQVMWYCAPVGGQYYVKSGGTNYPTAVRIYRETNQDPGLQTRYTCHPSGAYATIQGGMWTCGSGQTLVPPDEQVRTPY